MHGNGLDKLIQNNLIDYLKFISEHTEHSKHILETTQFPQQGQLPSVGQTDDIWSLISYVQQGCHS